MRNSQNEFNQTRGSLQSSAYREPAVANLQASMFGDKKKYSRRNIAQISSQDLKLKQPRAQTSHQGSRQLLKDQDSSNTAQFMSQMHPEEAEFLLDTEARNTVFKINMPHS